MADNLTANQESFIRKMTKSDEHATHGFGILLARSDLDKYFDVLKREGLFDPQHNNGPIPADEPGYVRIPYWSALGYLKAVSKLAGERDDEDLAQKVMNIVREVTRYRDPDGSARDNYHTYRTFSEILGLIPTRVITKKDLDMIPQWLISKFDRSGAGVALSRGIVQLYLESKSSEDWSSACTILRHLTAISRVNNKTVTALDGYWLKQLIDKHARTFGTKAGNETAKLLLERLHEVFSKESGDAPSYWTRPAVEDHDQNYSWREIENCFVQGLRDVLLAWLDTEPGAAQAFVEQLLQDDAEIARRIGIYIMNVKWTALRGIFKAHLNVDLFKEGHLHELYGLLNSHFVEFTDVEKLATVEAIRQIPLPAHNDKPQERLKYIQRRWLHAIAGKGHQAADNWYKGLNAETALGTISDHPDFLSYMMSWSGFGTSRYAVEEILAFAKDGTIIDKFNAFQQEEPFGGPAPSIRALVDALEDAISQDPSLFIERMPLFLLASRPYQYGIIDGFKKLWESTVEKYSRVDWDVTWVQLIAFFESLIFNPGFWSETVTGGRNLTPTRDWIPPIIAEFLRAGTRDDKKAYAPKLLPRGWVLINALLERLQSSAEPGDDAVFQAINSAKGKAIEALFDHALRVCRIRDGEDKNHASAWAEMKQAFEDELKKCRNANYEFSTLAANYIGQLMYLDKDWLRANLSYIFPAEHVYNFNCALEGLAYATASRQIYVLLAEKGIIDRSLKSDFSGRHAREKLMERFALAYLWGDEELNGMRFSYLYEANRADDLMTISNFFFSVHSQEITEDQKKRILSYWAHCVEWVPTLQGTPDKLLSSLSRLSCYIESLDETEVKLLSAVAPYVKINHHVDSFIEELDRLTERNPSAISGILKIVLANFVPIYDYEDRLKSLLLKLSASGRREDVLSYLEKIRGNLPTLANELFKQLTTGRQGN